MEMKCLPPVSMVSRQMDNGFEQRGIDYLSAAAYADLIPSHLVFLKGRLEILLYIKLILRGKRLATEDIMLSHFFFILYHSLFYTFNQLIIVVFWTVIWIVM